MNRQDGSLGPLIPWHAVRALEGIRTPSPFLESSLWTGATLWTRLLGFLQAVLLARWLGPQDFGRFSVLIGWMWLVQQPGDNGLLPMVLRALARAEGPRARLGALLRLGWTGLLAALSVVWALGAWTPPAVRWEIMGLSPFLLLPALWSLAGARLAAAGRLEVAARTVFLSRTLGRALILLAARLGWTALWAAVLLAMALDWLLLERAAGRWGRPLWRRPAGEPWIDRRAWLEAGEMLAIGLLGTLHFRVDSLLLAYLRGPEEVGRYSLAYRFYEAGLLLPTAAISVLLPRVATGRLPRRRILAFLATHGGIAVLLALLVNGIAGPLLRLPFGPAYAAAAPMLRLLAWPGPSSSPGGARDGIGAAANLALHLLLIPRLGGLGAALTTGLSTALIAGLLLLPFRPRGAPPQDPAERFLSR